MRKSTIEEDFSDIVHDLLINNVKARRYLAYCQSLNMCSLLFATFLYSLDENSYYPPGAQHLSSNRLFGMYHSCTDEANKRAIIESFGQPQGTIRVVFATMALGMGVDFKNLYYVIHYGAPRSLEDYLQESSRAGRDGQQAYSKVFWKPADVPLRQDQSNFHNREVAAVRKYLEDTHMCRRYMLLRYFDKVVADRLEIHDKQWCCDNCQSRS